MFINKHANSSQSCVSILFHDHDLDYKDDKDDQDDDDDDFERGEEGLVDVGDECWCAQAAAE